METNMQPFTKKKWKESKRNKDKPNNSLNCAWVMKTEEFSLN